MIQTPGRPVLRGKRRNDNPLEQSDEAELDALKRAVESLRPDAHAYYDRTNLAYNSWHSRWDGQTADGRKWAERDEDSDKIWPWQGASDTRTRTVEKIINEHLTVAMFAVMNMKLQAKSSRPAATIRESQQVTTLLNWQLFTHMAEELRRELKFLQNWKFAYGASILEWAWEQQRRVDYVNVQVPVLAEYYGQLNEQEPDIRGFSALLADPGQEEAMIGFIQGLSPIVSRPSARGILQSLRDLRYAEVPTPYIFVSKPKLCALRPMIDILYPVTTCDLQMSPYVDRVERVTESELVDRIETEGYDPNFVDAALDHKAIGRTDSFWRDRAMLGPDSMLAVYDADEFEPKVELHHCYRRLLVRGVPALFCTVFHMDVDMEAKHGPYGYKHGKYPYTVHRREHHERPINSSRGIPEVAYTWENEIKEQRDGRTDRTALALRPPLFTDYRDVLKYKAAFQPGVVMPERRDGNTRWFQPPELDQGSIEIERAVKEDIAEFFGLFGNELDPTLKAQRQQELADETLEELKPGLLMMLQLDQQYLPDAKVAAVVGPLARPFQLDREQIQGAYELSMTTDMRDGDPAFLKEKLGFFAQLAGMDTAGVLDWAMLIRLGAEAIDSTLADMAVKNTEEATDKERQDELQAISLIIGSGLDQPMPKGGNYQLRLQTLDSTIGQAMQNNPNFVQRLKQFPDSMKQLANRRKFFVNQLQQQENAQIGRMLTTQTFSKDAPEVADMSKLTAS